MPLAFRDEPVEPTEDKIKAARQLFHILDADESGLLDESELFTLLACLDYNPGEGDVATVMEKFDNNGSKQLSEGEFVRMLAFIEENERNPAELEGALRLLTKGAESLSYEEMKWVLTNLGKPLTSEQADAILSPVARNDVGDLKLSGIVEVLQPL